MNYKPQFSINDYDCDGDKIDSGVYLHFDETRIKVADSLSGYVEFIHHLQSMEGEISGEEVTNDIFDVDVIAGKIAKRILTSFEVFDVVCDETPSSSKVHLQHTDDASVLEVAAEIKNVINKEY